MTFSCETGRVIIHVIITIVALILFSTTLYAIFKYFRFYTIHKDNRPRQSLFMIGATQLLISSSTLGVNFIIFIKEWITCFNYDGQEGALFWLFMSCYTLQTYLLWLILFFRLYFVFEGSVYELSRLSYNILRFILILMPILVFFLFLPIWTDTALLILTFMCFIASMTFCILITTIFVYKLFLFYKKFESNTDVNDKDNIFLSTITKNTILTIISISSTVLNAILFVITWYNHLIVFLIYMRGFTFLFDVYTNFVCILFTYKWFDLYYIKCCGFMDNQCRSCCSNMMKNKNEVTIVKQSSIGSQINAVI
eukprot:457333_1